MAHWNYRVVRTVHTDEVDLTIREVYYNDAGEINGMTGPIEPRGENLDELRTDLQRMLDSLAKPVLDDVENSQEPGAISDV